ncbi:MAG TPA: universal stress protein [Terriglobia bacterium]|nr:universal stress protein [Terriglobia bacterium]
MLRIEQILCPVDFSESSVKAYDYAQSVARHYHAKLLLQHVVDFIIPPYSYYAPASYLDDLFQQVRTDAREELHKFAKSHTRNGVQPECVVQEGDAMYSILSFAEAQMVDLIVMGTHGIKGLDRVTLGSVAEKVLRKARCPVLVVRKPGPDAVAPEGAQSSVELRRVVFCTDFSDPSRRALEYALSAAAEYDAELTLLHVLEDMPRSADIEEAIATATQQLDKLIPPEGVKPGKIKTLVRIGRAYEQIIQLALEIQADLLIMAVRGRNALDLAVFGSTTYRVIQLGPCPVLAVHVLKAGSSSGARPLSVGRSPGSAGEAARV